MATTKSRSFPAVRGGKAKMAGKMATGTQRPGQSAQLGRGGGKWGSGGSGHMFGKSSVKPAKPA